METVDNDGGSVSVDDGMRFVQKRNVCCCRKSPEKTFERGISFGKKAVFVTVTSCDGVGGFVVSWLVCCPRSGSTGKDRRHGWSSIGVDRRKRVAQTVRLSGSEGAVLLRVSPGWISLGRRRDCRWSGRRATTILFLTLEVANSRG